MKKILYKLFVLCAFVVTLTGCELYMDDRDIQLGEVVADGDGYSAPATFMDSITTVTYQFNENTVYINEPYRPHIFSANVDTAAGTIEIRFAKSIPADMMPQRGNCLATSLYDIFNNNVCHKVDVVEEADGLYVVKGHAVPTKEVFKHLRVRGSFYVDGDTTQVENDSRTGDEPLVVEPILRPVTYNYTNRADEEYVDPTKPKDYNLFSVNLSLNTLDKIWNVAHGKKLEDDFFKAFKKAPDVSNNSIQPKKFKLVGAFTGLFGLSYSITLRFSFDIDLDNGYHDIHALIYHEVLAGVGISEFHGSILAPLIGGQDFTGKVTSPNPKTPLQSLKIAKNEWIFKSRAFHKDYPTKIGVFTLDISPNSFAEIYADIYNSEPIGFYFRNSAIISEFGKHKDANSDFYYGEEGHKTTLSEPNSKFIDFTENTNLDDYGFKVVGAKGRPDLSLDIGAAIHSGLTISLTYMKTAQIYLNVTPGALVHYYSKLNNKYKFDVKVLDPKTNEEKAISSLDDSYYESKLFISIALGGRIDARVTTIDLFRKDWSFDFFRIKKRLIPEFKTTVVSVPEESDDKLAFFRATVERKTKDSEYFNFIEIETPPKLAIYKIPKDTKNWTELYDFELDYIGYFEPTNGTDKYDKNTKYEYTFSLPYRINYLDVRTCVAIPYFDTFLGLKYSNGTMFKYNSGPSWGVINDLQQVSIYGGQFEEDAEPFGLCFTVEGNSTKEVAKWSIKMYITDLNTNRQVANYDFDIGRLKADELKKFIFYFLGTSPSGYEVDVFLRRYAIQDEFSEDDGEGTIYSYETEDHQKIELSPYIEGSMKISLDDYNNGTVNGYEVLE